MRYGAKVDVMHGTIRDGLRQAGVAVIDGARWGRGAPDLLCWTRHTGWVPLEIKSRRTDYKAKKVRGLTDDQVKLHALAPIPVVETMIEALDLFGMR
jgi:hypothetical protein